MAKMIMTRAEIDSNRAKWLEARNKGIGGSDAGIIVGLNTHKTKFTLWMEKTGQAEPENISDKEAIKWGNRLENVIAEAFSEETGKKVRKCGMVQSEEYPWMLADVDRMIVGENALLEIKTTNAWNSEAWKGDSLPDTYYTQVLHYMIVCDVPKAYICCLVGGQHMVWKEVLYNEEDAKILIEAEKEFWEKNVIGREMPEVDGTDSCTEALKKKFEKGGDTEPLDLDDTFDILLKDRDRYKAEVNKLNKTITEIENKIRLELGNKEFGRSFSYNVYNKVFTRSGFQTKEFAKDFPDLYEKYYQQSTYRKLDIRVSKARTKEA